MSVCEQSVTVEPDPSALEHPSGLVRSVRRIGLALLRLPRAAGALALLAWAALIHHLSSLPDPSPDGVRVPLLLNDLAHAPLFGMLAFLALVALPRRGEPFPWPVLDRRTRTLILIGVVLYGLVDEYHQSFTPGRHASPFDILTDLAGAWAVLGVAQRAGNPAARGADVLGAFARGAAACLAAASWATLSVALGLG